SPWTIGDELIAGDTSTGTLRILEGGVVTNTRATLGRNQGSVGVVVIQDAGSSWTSSQDVRVGAAGEGSVLFGGGTVSSAGLFLGTESTGSGTITIDNGQGAGADWTNDGDLVIGAFGGGEVRITNSGSLQNDGNLVAAEQAGSSGALVIERDGSLDVINNNRVIIGDGGNARLTIRDGGDMNIAGTGDLIVADENTSTSTVTVSGTGSTLSTNNLAIARDGNGSLLIQNEAVVTSRNDSFMATNAGSIAKVDVGGVGAAWNTAGDAIFGDGGSAELNIRLGGAVNVDGDVSIGARDTGSGVVNVGGVGSTFTSGGTMTFGAKGRGDLNVTSGGVVQADTILFGNESGGNSTVRVDGAGSQVLSDESIFVGGVGDAEMTVSRGALVRAGAGLSVGSNENGVVTVDGAGTRLEVGGKSSRSLTVGYFGDAELSVTDGAVVEVEGTTATRIGRERFSTGSVLIDGTGSELRTHGLNVGEEGAGDLTISNGGRLLTRGDSSIGDDFDSNDRNGKGSVVVDGAGSEWVSDGLVSIGRRGEGNLTIRNGGTVSVDLALIGSDAVGTGAVTIDGVGSRLVLATDFRIGASGSGSVTLSNGGAIDASAI
ncbi:unnamed protein product, partial [Ectocarpus sp. 12 AP-2014]